MTEITTILSTHAHAHAQAQSQNAAPQDLVTRTGIPSTPVCAPTPAPGRYEFNVPFGHSRSNDTPLSSSSPSPVAPYRFSAHDTEFRTASTDPDIDRGPFSILKGGRGRDPSHGPRSIPSYYYYPHSFPSATSANPGLRPRIISLSLGDMPSDTKEVCSSTVYHLDTRLARGLSHPLWAVRTPPMSSPGVFRKDNSP